MSSDTSRAQVHAGKGWERLRSTYLTLTAFERHKTILAGIPTRDLTILVKALEPLSSEVVYQAIGYRPPSEGESDAHLPSQASDAFVSLLDMTDRATRVLGDRHEAVLWLSRPALALGGQVPLALIVTRSGVEGLQTLLAQMDHGVYV